MLVGLVFGLVSGLRHGWLEVRWDRLFHDLGLPGARNPDASASGTRPPDQAAAPLPLASSSAREARNPSR